jgi:hypothetical protein
MIDGDSHQTALHMYAFFRSEPILGVFTCCIFEDVSGTGDIISVSVVYIRVKSAKRGASLSG